MFGALAPLPMRLGGTRQDGWLVGGYLRMCADAANMVNAMPFARITYTLASGVITVHAYVGMNGVGPAAAPISGAIATGAVTWAWSESYTDVYGIARSVRLRHAHATPHSSSVALTGQVQTEGIHGVAVWTTRFDTGAAADCKVTLTVY